MVRKSAIGNQRIRQSEVAFFDAGSGKLNILPCILNGAVLLLGADVPRAYSLQ